MRQQPHIVARYDQYAITHGVTHGMYYAFHADTFIGMEKTLDEAIDIIALREGMYFERERVEVYDGSQ